MSTVITSPALIPVNVTYVLISGFSTFVSPLTFTVNPLVAQYGTRSFMSNACDDAPANSLTVILVEEEGKDVSWTTFTPLSCHVRVDGRYKPTYNSFAVLT